jgi:Cu2+-exporting ATPase
MSCCGPSVDMLADAGRMAAREELRLASKPLDGELHQTDLSVPGIHCAGCIGTIETGLSKVPGVEHVRVNLSTKRVSVKWRGAEPPALLETLGALGFAGHLFDAGDERKDPELGRLIQALAVAGFCAMNIMLLSVSVWSGADVETRATFHWISAALALPCLLYSGRIFFQSAWSALRLGRTNMDVPISIGICLAFGLSLYDTIHSGAHAYFDAATSLIFFLLIGRTLDHMMREKARAAVRGLMRLTPRGAMVLRDDGGRDYLPLSEIEPGMRIAVAAGDRIPVDGMVVEGVSDLDCAIATGESVPQHVDTGSQVRAGTLNLSGPLTIVASVRPEHSFLAEMVRLMEAAEGGRPHYRRLADRAAQLYSPVVHATAFLTFLGWMAATGDWHQSTTVGIAVLIVTCPCALGLAVPIVQVMAARRLFENGIMVKDGTGLERLAEIDTVIFDKTGTLTIGQPELIDVLSINSEMLAIAAALGARSSHPFSRALAAASGDCHADIVLEDVKEVPGLGLEARANGSLYRLGRGEWAIDTDDAQRLGTVLARDGRLLASFAFEDQLRPGATGAISALLADGLKVEILSGDRSAAVSSTAKGLGVGEYAAGLMPGDKVDHLKACSDDGRKVLMVGDGLNDAPALAVAYVSMAPASAADIGRNAADFVFLRESLDAVPKAFAVAKDAGKLVRQNFALAIAYNAIALPIAIAGYVTPLIAALAMSLSSIIVVANALRLGSGKLSRRPDARSANAVASRPLLEPAE